MTKEFSKKPNPAENHHTVPRLYLKRFAKDGNLIQCVEIGNAVNSRQISIRKASVIKKFYNLPDQMVEEGGISPDEFEKWLDVNIENHAAPVIEKIVEKDMWLLNQEDRGTLARFLATQFLRTEEQREVFHYITNELMTIKLLKSGKEKIKEILENEYHTSIQDHEVDSTWNLLKEGKFRKNMIPLHNIQFIDENIHKVAEVLMAKHWMFIDFGKLNLITSDSPLFLYPILEKKVQEDGTEEIISRPAGVKDSPEIWFPLSRNMGLVLFNDKKRFDEKLEGNEKLHKEFISHIANKAYREIYCHPDDLNLIPKDLKRKEWNEFILPVVD